MNITDLLGAMPAWLIGPVPVLLALLGVLAAIAWKLGSGGTLSRPAPEDGASAITQIRTRAGNGGLVIVSRQRPALFDCHMGWSVGDNPRGYLGARSLPSSLPCPPLDPGVLIGSQSSPRPERQRQL